jgi:carbon-monoxide dehydrogenase medium subunit
MALRVALPKHLVDINGVAGFDRLAVGAGELSISACVRHAAFQRPVVDGPLGALLATVVQHIAHYPIRTRGTFCGSLANADPASEWCLVAATLGAKMVAQSVRGARIISASDFFQDVMTTALETDELLAEARLPLLAADARWGFYEFNRRKGDFAIAMSLVVYRLESNLIVTPFVGVGGVESKPRRVSEAERALVGQRPCAETFQAAADKAAVAVTPMQGDPEVSTYKRDLVRAAVRRALHAADTGVRPI